MIIKKRNRARLLVGLTALLVVSALIFTGCSKKLELSIGSEKITDEEFLNDMQVLVEEYIKTVTGKKKKKAKDFKKSLRPQISLEEKIMKVYEG